MSSASDGRSTNKRQKLDSFEDSGNEVDGFSDEGEVIVEFYNTQGEHVGDQFCVNKKITKAQLLTVLRQVLRVHQSDEDGDFYNTVPFALSLLDGEVDINASLADALSKQKNFSAEVAQKISFVPLASFKVRPVTRCSSTLQGHSEAILCCSFSPDSSKLCTGGGDHIVRIWDVETETPTFSLNGHTGWVLSVAWAPHGQLVASAGMDCTVRLWDPNFSGSVFAPLKGHTQCITALSWQHCHFVDEGNATTNDEGQSFGTGSSSGQTKTDWRTRLGFRLPDMLLASASKDCTIRIWRTGLAQPLRVLGGHTQPVMQVKWLGLDDLVASASRDTTIKIWDPRAGSLVTELKGHAHWINTLALSTDYTTRSGPYDHEGLKNFKTFSEMKRNAKRRLDEFIKNNGMEALLSGSDDQTMILRHHIGEGKFKLIGRMTGHIKQINHVSFSPDCRFLVSASFDKTIRLWNGKTGQYLATLRGHVGPVYMTAWSSDSRLILSGSGDGTLKVWDVAFRKISMDLPGHADEVFCLDWSCNGIHAASGSKDRTLKMWKH